MEMPVREALRQKGSPYDELGLADPKWTDEHLIGFMLQHPILINRPIVVTPLGTRLCRPSEAVLDILPQRQCGALERTAAPMLVQQASCDGGQVGARLPQGADFFGIAQHAQKGVMREIRCLIAVAELAPPPLAKPFVMGFAEKLDRLEGVGHAQTPRQAAR